MTSVQRSINSDARAASEASGAAAPRARDETQNPPLSKTSTLRARQQGGISASVFTGWAWKAVAAIGYKALLASGIVAAVWATWNGYQDTRQENATMRKELATLARRQAATLATFNELSDRELERQSINEELAQAVDALDAIPRNTTPPPLGINADACIDLPLPFELPAIDLNDQRVRIIPSSPANRS